MRRRSTFLLALVCATNLHCKPRLENSGLRATEGESGGGCMDLAADHNSAACDKVFKDNMFKALASERNPLYEGEQAKRGRWSDPINTPGNQAVHMFVLPSGKVVIYNGSSNRLALTGGKDDDTDHKAPWIYDNWGIFEPSSGAFDLKRRITSMDDLPCYRNVRNPDAPNDPCPKQEAEEILVDLNGEQSSKKVSEGNWNMRVHNNDSFCGNKSHLPNGDVMFVGGSNKYNPFKGARVAWHFNWEKEAFDYRYLIGDGHWYPSIVTMGDGKIVVLSGYGMNNAQNIFEDKFFAPEPGFDQLNPAKTLPYLERAKKETVATGTWNVEVYNPKTDKWYFQSIENLRVAGLNKSFKSVVRRFDTFPRAGLMPFSNEIMLSGDGAAPGMRTAENRHLLFLKVELDDSPDAKLKLSMRAQPDARCFAGGAGGGGGGSEGSGDDEELNPCTGNGDATLKDMSDKSFEVPAKAKAKFMARSTNYQTFAVDPRTNNNDFLIIGGHYGSNVSFALEDTATPMEHASADILEFHMPTAKQGDGRVKLTLLENVLGNRWKTKSFCEANPEACPINKALCDNPGPRANECLTDKNIMTAPYRNVDARVMHVATILPTQEVLVMGGANLSYRGPRMHPQLLTANGQGTWDVTEMAPQEVPRTYHTASVLLPDGRVLLGGGNNGLARVRMDNLGSVKPNDPSTWSADKLPLDQRPGVPDLGPLEADGAAKGMPMEIHWLEVFSPPYLFKGERPTIKGLRVGKDFHPNGQPKTNADLVGIALGEDVQLEVDGAGDASEAKVTLVKLGAVTHSGDQGQRLFKLCGPAVVQNAANEPGPCKLDRGNVALKFPGKDERNLLPAGVYMMFFVDGRGVPSVSQMVKVL